MNVARVSVSSIDRLASLRDSPEPRVRMRFFGQPEVLLDGAPLPQTRTRKALWLLAVLALRGGSEVDRAWLAGTLWPDSDDIAALRSLRQSLHDLKTALRSLSTVVVSPSTRSLRLDLPDAWVDVLEFDRLVELGDTLAMEEAVRLYRGPLLEGCAGEWAIPERQAREEALVSALERLAELASGNGDNLVAARHLRRAVDVAPFREDLWQRLMTARADARDASGAAEAYREVRSLLWSEMASHPAEETTELYKRIRAEALRSPTKVPTPKGEARAALTATLPLPLTDLIGRDRHARDVESLLSKSRLVTLTGTGGIGKTRLAIQAAYSLCPRTEDGCYFVELAETRDRFQVVEAVRRVLRLPEADGQTDDVHFVALEIGEREVLLTLDNCEQVDRACAELVQSLLRSCPAVRLLITSRHPLGVRGEAVWPVPTLAFPPVGIRLTPETLIEYPAVKLFVERAQDAKPGFTITEHNAEAIAEICRRLDGLPLAIELAACRVFALSVFDIARQLGRSLRLLRSRGRESERHGTLTAAFDWSWELLSEEERAVLARLSVFAGGWTLAAAQVVCADDNIDEDAVVDLLAGLVEKSLVTAEERADEMRYRLLEPVRQYAVERLASRGEEASVRAKHQEYFLAMAEESAAKLLGPEQAHWYAVLAEEHDNLRAALAFCIDAAAKSQSEDEVEKALRFGAALQQFWRTHGHLREGRQILAGLLAVSGGSQSRARADALNAAATFAHLQRDFTAARSLYDESLGIRRHLGDRKAMAGVLNNLGLMAAELQDYASAHTLYEEALSINRQTGNRDWEAINLSNLGLIAQETGDHQSARQLLEQSLALYREVGDLAGSADPLFTLALVEKNLGNNASGQMHLRQSLAISQQMGDTRGVAYCIEAFASIAVADKDFRSAALLWAAAARLREAIGSPLSPKERDELAKERAVAESFLGETAFLRATSEGAEMPFQQVLSLTHESDAGGT